MASVTSIGTPSFHEVEDFMESSGVLRSIMLDGAVIGLRRKLTSEGAVCCVRRDGRLRLRALLARRWACSSSERIEAKIVGDILAMNPYARVEGVKVRKHGRYVEVDVVVT